MKKPIPLGKTQLLEQLNRQHKNIRISIFLILSLAILLFIYFFVRDYIFLKKVENISNQSKLTQNIESDKALQAEVYFNEQPRQHIFSEKITEVIRSSKKTIEIAMYSFDLKSLRDELYAAAKRGVKVTIILNDIKLAQHSSLFKGAPLGVKLVSGGVINNDQNYSYDMHHKFMIVDRGLDSSSLTNGSFNWTDRQEYYDPSYVMISKDPQLINVFGQEFDRLLLGIGGINKTKTNFNPDAAKITYPNGWLEIWFGPGSNNTNARQRLISLLNSAQKEIDVMIWQFTDRDLADEFVKAAKSGIKIKLLYDNFPARQPTSVIPYLQQTIKDNKILNFELIGDDKHNNFTASDNLPVNFDSYLHRHEVIVDDSVVWAGTNNWGNAGWWFNDENIIISNNKLIVKSFKDSFNFNYNNLK